MKGLGDHDNMKHLPLVWVLRIFVQTIGLPANTSIQTAVAHDGCTETRKSISRRTTPCCEYRRHSDETRRRRLRSFVKSCEKNSTPTDHPTSNGPKCGSSCFRLLLLFNVATLFVSSYRRTLLVVFRHPRAIFIRHCLQEISRANQLSSASPLI